MKHNPYRYGAPVTADDFCGREAELSKLTGLMRSGIHAFLLSPRRYGKTSLLEESIDRFRTTGGRAGLVNLLACTTEDEVASRTMTVVVREILRPTGRARHNLEEILRGMGFSPRVSVGPDGSINLTIDPQVVSGAWLDVLTEAIRLLERSSSKSGAALVFDEFQQVADLGPRGMGGVFKALADQTKHSSLVLSGSHLSTMEGLTSHPGAPLLKMGEQIRLPVVPAEDMVPHLVERAASGGKTLSEETATFIYTEAAGIPNEVKRLAHVTYEIARGRNMSDAHVGEAVAQIVSQESEDFADTYQRLSHLQKRVLNGIAIRPIAQIYSKESLAVLKANTNAIRKALDALREKHQLIELTPDGWVISNPFFRRWVGNQSA